MCVKHHPNGERTAARMSEDALIGLFTYFLITKTLKVRCQSGVALLPGPEPNPSQKRGRLMSSRS